MPRVTEEQKVQRRKTLIALARAVETFPSLRIGQIIGNALGETPVYYASDNDLRIALDEYTSEYAQ